MKIIVEKIMAWRPCYPESRVREVIGTGKTPREVCDLTIPAADRIWVLTRPGAVTKRKRVAWLALLLDRCFARERAAGREPHRDTLAVLDLLREYCPGAVWRAKMCAAADAAHAARAAAYAAADATAYNYTAAAYAAARAATYAAAAAAAYAAADATAAYDYTAAAAEREAQIADWRTVLAAQKKGGGKR